VSHSGPIPTGKSLKTDFESDAQGERLSWLPWALLPIGGTALNAWKCWYIPLQNRTEAQTSPGCRACRERAFARLKRSRSGEKIAKGTKRDMKNTKF